MKGHRRIFLWMIKIACPIMFVIFPILIVYGHLYPFNESDYILSEYDYRKKLLIGMNIEYGFTDGYDEDKIEYSYILIPKAIILPKIVTVINHNNKLSFEEQSPYSLYLVVFAFLLAAYGTWRFWFKPKQCT